MGISRFFNRQAVLLAVTAVMLIAVAAPGVLTAVVRAAQATDRSIELSSSSRSATNVKYNVKFTAPGAADAFVVDFCSNTPSIGLTCATPGGFVATGVGTDTPDFTVSALDSNTVVVVGDITAADDVEVELKGITNPSAAGPLYARIVTYDSEANANAYVSDDIDTEAGGVVDTGSIAISITNAIGVSAAVPETMTFCVSGAAITANCGTTTAPVLQLGETVGDTKALVSDQVSSGSIYAQLSTNAVGGAAVSLKSSALNCGGLVRSGAPTACDIAPAQKTDIDEGEAKFGVKVDSTADTGTSPVGVLQAVADSGYNDSTYAFNYASGNATGVTSTYGDPFLDTDNAPANNKNVQLTFGASVSNSTPAGLYSTSLSLVATGKF